MKSRVTLEDIREHLEKGGRVMVNSGFWSSPREVECVSEPTKAILFKEGGAIYFDERLHWELLPLPQQSKPAPPLMDGIRALQQNGSMEKFRKKLMFGQPLTLDEQLALWEAVTGETFEYGRRCSRCHGNGKTNWNGAIERRIPVTCDNCKGEGYSVVPTWRRLLTVDG